MVCYPILDYLILYVEVHKFTKKTCSADDILTFVKPSLERHVGCDLVDIYPGAGLWSSKLHDALQPRSHILLEPDEELYRPFLEPLLAKKGATLIPKSGIVWRDLSGILNPTHLPHQHERLANDPNPRKGMIRCSSRQIWRSTRRGDLPCSSH